MPAFTQSLRGGDASPLDYAYLPDNFAHDRKNDDKAVIRVTYSRPATKDRELFGKLVPYGKVWRTGANESTEIKFYQDVTVGGTLVKAGTYAMFTIPEKDSWTIILNSNLDYWGAYSYKAEKDVYKIPATVETSSKPVDLFTIQFDKSNMMLAWGTVMAKVSIQY